MIDLSVLFCTTSRASTVLGLSSRVVSELVGCHKAYGVDLGQEGDQGPFKHDQVVRPYVFLCRDSRNSLHCPFLPPGEWWV